MDNIENLQIEIKAKATGVADELNNLADALVRVRTAAGGGAGLGGVAAGLNKTGQTLSGTVSRLNSTKLRFSSIISFGKKAVSVFSDLVSESNDYIENLNLFTVAMGDYAKEAKAYAEEVQAIMGIDASEWMRTQGVFMTLATGFGVAANDAALMSESLTELGYDLSSFFNISVADAMQKLQSGFAGELEPLRRLGYDLSQAKLQQIAYANGVDRTISSMTQGEKAQLRYVAIMTQVQSAHGDLARTLEAPANQLRILQAASTQTARAVGNIFIPALNAALPYVIGFANVITWAAQTLANLFGFALPEIDYSGLESITASAGDAENALGGAAGAAKDLKNAMLGMDELNVISPQNASGGGGGALTPGDLGLDLSQYDYDFLGDAVAGKAKQIAEKIKSTFKPVFSFIFDNIESIIDLAFTVGETILLWHIAKTFINGLNSTVSKMSELWKIARNVDKTASGFERLFAGTAGFVLSIAGMSIEYQGFEAIGAGNAKLLDYLKAGLGSALGVLGTTLTLMTVGAPLGAAVAIGLTAALIVGIKAIFKGYEGSLIEAFYASPIGEQLTDLGAEIEKIKNVNVDISTKLEGIDGAVDETLLSNLTLARDLTKDIFDINEQENLTVGQLLILQDNVATLNSLGLDGIQLELDETGRIAGATRDQISGIIDELLNQYQVEAMRDAYIDAYKLQIQEEQNMRDAVQAVTEAERIRNALQTELGETQAELNETTKEFQRIADSYDLTKFVQWPEDVRNEYVQLITKSSDLRGEYKMLNAGLEESDAKYSELMEELENTITGYDAAGEKVGWLRDRLSELTTSTNETTSEMNTAGSDIVNGLANGITENAYLPAERIHETAANMLKEFQLFNDINSPSGLYEEQARFIMQGLAGGFRSNKSMVVTAFNNVLNALIDNMEIFANRTRTALNDLLGDYSKSMSSVTVNAGGGVSYSRVPTRTIPGFASGGFPEAGQIFLAREAGPELVGTIGGRTAVANNEDIVAAMTRGVYAGITAAQAGADSGAQNITVAVYMNDEPITDAVKRVETRSGTSIFNGGVL